MAVVADPVKGLKHIRMYTHGKFSLYTSQFLPLGMVMQLQDTGMMKIKTYVSKVVEDKTFHKQRFLLSRRAMTESKVIRTGDLLE